jgi:hypothetical protein
MIRSVAWTTRRNALTMSVIVTIPTSLPSAVTGSPPILCSSIRRAAFSTLSPGLTVMTSVRIAAFTWVWSRAPVCSRMSRSVKMPTSLPSSTHRQTPETAGAHQSLRRRKSIAGADRDGIRDHRVRKQHFYDPSLQLNNNQLANNLQKFRMKYFSRPC